MAMDAAQVAELIAEALEPIDALHARLHRLLWQSWSQRARMDTSFAPVAVEDVCQAMGLSPDFFGIFANEQTLVAVHAVAGLKTYQVEVERPTAHGAGRGVAPLWIIVAAPPTPIPSGEL